MYEMYPDGWTASEERREVSRAAEHPRRRTRKVHSVLPPVLSVEPVSEPVMATMATSTAPAT
jgi:hypothetical protein